MWATDNFTPERECDGQLRPIVGWEGLYSVCPAGHVRSHRNRKWLRVAVASHGYENVILFHDGRKKGMLVHRLVYAAHVGPVPPRMDINHINGVKTDNRVGNLEVLTRKENMAHAVRIGIYSSKGEAHGGARLTDAGVLDILARRAKGERVKDIASIYGVRPSHVGSVLHGRAWRHVTHLRTATCTKIPRREGRAPRPPDPR